MRPRTFFFPALTFPIALAVALLCCALTAAAYHPQAGHAHLPGNLELLKAATPALDRADPAIMPRVLLAEDSRIKNYAHPDWVHPLVRPSYAGYRQLKDRKKTAKEWTYSVNRPGGKIKGGGTVEYEDYKPFYFPPYYYVPRKPGK